jgi:hypothetical protein
LIADRGQESGEIENLKRAESRRQPQVYRKALERAIEKGKAVENIDRD